MTVQQLIAHLQTMPPQGVIYIWHDGERYPISEGFPLDPWDAGDDKIVVDINVHQD